LGSANRSRGHQIGSNVHKKRNNSDFSSSTNSSLSLNAISIHGAGLPKPSSSLNNINEQTISSSSAITNYNNNINDNYNNNNISAAYLLNYNNQKQITDENSFVDNNAFISGNFDYNQENINEQLNLLHHHNNKIYASNITNTNTNSNSNISSSNNTYNSLPPIENSLKPLRIRSANNLKQTKQRTERPFTSTNTKVNIILSSI
jgi:hypothetical protein